MASIAPLASAYDHGNAGNQIGDHQGDPGEESLIILQSLICLMREKNLLTRADVEELCQKVDRRARGESQIPLPCCSEAAHGASGLMHRLATYIGHRYGGKHARV